MRTFEWNGLRPGDAVLVHGPGATDMTLIPGLVTKVEAHRTDNGVGIRTAAGSPGRSILWPAPAAVHTDPRDPHEPCWRCDASAR